MITNVKIWLTPIWLLSLGITAGAAVLLALFGILWLVARPQAEAAARMVRNGILNWVSYVVGAFVIFALLATYFMPWQLVTHSLARLRHVGKTEISVTVPAKTDDMKVAVDFDADELQSYSFVSDQDLVIDVEPKTAYAKPMIRVEGVEPYVWTPSSKVERQFKGHVDTLFVTNESDAPAKLRIQIETDVPYPQVRQIIVAAAAVVGVYLFYLLQHVLFPRISIIAAATAKEAVAQPLYLLVLLIGAFLLMLYVIIPYNTFGEDVKMYKDSGMMTIKVLAIMFALWTASVSVADEIEGRTALTLLSKPISRRQFVLGKFMGIVWPVFLMFVILGAWMLIWVSCKVVYDARETSNPEPSWQLCSTEMIGTVPGLVLAFMEAVVLTAVSVAISTRLPMLPNLIICGSIYVLGNLGPLIVQSGIGRNEFVSFFGQLVALVLPMLDVFNVQAAVAGGKYVPPDYLAWALLYCVAYSAVAMLLGLILFEDRDLA